MADEPIDVEQRVRASFDRQGFMSAMGAHVASVGDGQCVVALPFSPEVTQVFAIDSGQETLVAIALATITASRSARET